MSNVVLEYLIYLFGAVLFLAVIIHRAGKNSGTFLGDVTEADGEPPQRTTEPPNRGVVCILTKVGK